MSGHPATRWTAEQVIDTGPEPLWSVEHREPPGWRARRPRSPRPHLGHITSYPDATACALRPQAESVKVARDFAKKTLHGWGLAELADDLGLVVSELVTNALRHAVILDPEDLSQECSPPDHPAASPARHRRPIQLSLQRNGAQIVCAVSDPSDDIPVRREPDQIAETGRGLHLVECFSRAWGWTPLTDCGKVVWALFCPSR